MSDLRASRFTLFLELRDAMVLGQIQPTTATIAGQDLLFSPESCDLLTARSLGSNIENAQSFLMAHHQRINLIYPPECLHQYHRLPLRTGSNDVPTTTLWQFTQCTEEAREGREARIDEVLKNIKNLDNMVNMETMEQDSTQQYKVWEHNSSLQSQNFEDKNLEHRILEDKSSEEKSLDEKSSEDKSLEDQSLEDQSLEDKSLEDKSLQDQRLQDQSLQEPGVLDPGLQESSLLGPSLQQPSLQDHKNNELTDKTYEITDYLQTKGQKFEIAKLSNDNPESLVENRPNKRFRDPLLLNFIGTSMLEDMEDARYFKNNLAAVVTSSYGNKLFVVAVLTYLNFYPFDPLTNCPEDSPILLIDMTPLVTSIEQRQNLTWRDNPHTINSIKTCPNWFGKEVLISCGDDGNIYMWNSDALIFSAYESNNLQETNTGFEPLHIIVVPASAWSADICSYNDSKGNTHNVVVATYNSRKVELLYYKDSGFISICSDLLPHNVPEVSFLSCTEHDGNHEAVISMASISNDLMTYSITWKMDLENNLNFKSINIRALLCYRLDQELWTAKPIDSKYFLKVGSLEEVNGDFTQCPMEKARIMFESKILSSEIPDQRFSSSLGIAAGLQTFDVPVVSFDPPTMEDDLALQRRIDHYFNSVAQAYIDFQTESILKQKQEPLSQKLLRQKTLSQKFLAVSSHNTLALYRADTLICCARTREVFTKTPTPPPDAMYSNRIQITLLIPELSCFIAVTQLGVVSILRFCQHRGVFGMRQEHIFPHLSWVENETEKRTIIGISSKSLSVTAEEPRYMLYVVFSDGKVLNYILKAQQLQVRKETF